MRVTIYTDASHIPGTNTGTFAFWIRWEHGRLIKNGKFKDEILDSYRAEVRCVLNAIYFAKKNIANIDTLFMVTDCTPVINLLKHRNNKPATLIKMSGEIVAYEGLTKGITVHWKHVKGHKGGRTMQSYINEQCDKLAREARYKK